jgi:hypothetical protein
MKLLENSKTRYFKSFRIKSLSIGILVVFAIALGACSSNSSSTATTNASNSIKPVADKLTIETGKMDGKSGWPKYVPSSVTVPANTTVKLTIVSYDDGTAPLLTGMTQYVNVQGGTETVDGNPVTSVPNSNISHTFTVPSLGLNAVIPAVPSGQNSVTVVFTFKVSKPGTYVWHCFAPCGSGSTGMEGSMATMGWMKGSFVVS